ncbi:MAG: ATP-binding protein [Algoriphagus sp.]|nr:ATP-binding protein [Algoriphagus sp.]
MKRLTPNTNTAGKVVVGFLLAAIFLIGVAGLTYYTLHRLMDTMEELAQPNQKLNLLNELQAEIFKTTQIDQLGPEGDFRVQDSTIRFLEAKLDLLNEMAADSLEKANVQSIRANLATLINGYLALYEVKGNLANRNFTQEALKKVELGIRRRAAVIESQPLSELNPKDFIFNELKQQNNSRQELKSGRNTQEDDKLIAYLKELQQQNVRGNNSEQSQTLDSVLYNIRKVISRIYREEATQRQELASLESDLSLKQSEIIGTIQSLLGTLQRRAIEESESQNQSAFGLAYDVTFFLILVVALSVFGSAFLVISILKEIRLNRKYQENLEISTQKSEELARSKQEFLANMSHEIRNPLHVIQGYRSVLEKSELNQNQQSHLRMIGFASDTLMEIVDEVLDFSKLEAGKLELESRPFDPEELFGALQNFFELQASEKKLEFDWSLELPEGRWLIGDQLRLKQIINNLLSNSFKFTSHGSIQVHVNWGKNTLSVEILDTGIGMNPEVLAKVFREFDQADNSISRKYGGTGLGLAIVNRLVTLMGGEIEVESEEDKGTKMRIRLPMITTDPLPVFSDSLAIGAIDLTGKNILLVDDDKVGLRYLETVLTYFGATVFPFSGGVKYRDEFKEIALDMAIIDIQMPEFSGFEVIKSLRNYPQYQGLPVIAMTANVFVEDREKMLHHGFNDLIFKPFQEKALLACLSTFFPDRVILESPVSQVIPEKGSALFQLKDLRRFCMGDESLLEEIVKEMILQTRSDMVKLKTARLNDRWEDVLEICHQLGSRLGQIQSPSGEIARKIESSLKLGTKNGLGELLNQLDKQVDELLKALSSHIYLTDPMKV